MTLHTWWASWGALTQRLLSLFASFASMGGVLFAFLPPTSEMPAWAWIVLFFAGMCLLLLVILEFGARRHLRVYRKSDGEGIRQYMQRWIEHGGVAAIWTRDMTWAQNADMRKLLKEKAKKHELVLCLPEKNELARELAGLGADVYEYGRDILESPSSRFTITSYGKSGSMVAVGRPRGEIHVIEEFDEGGHPAFALAHDLVSFAKTTSRYRNVQR